MGGKKQLYGAKKRIGIYAGQYYDHETGLHYNYHRYYDPKLGRYLRADPDSGNIYKPKTLALYTYVQNNPINGVDPYGLREKWKFDCWVEKTYKHGICYYVKQFAQCIKKKKKCNGESDEYEIKHVFVSYEQYLPIRLGVPNSHYSGGYPGDGLPGPDLSEELAKTYCAIQDAKMYGSRLGRNYVTRSTKNGQDYCDKL